MAQKDHLFSRIVNVLITSLNRVHGLNPIVQRLFDPLDELTPTPSVENADAVFLSVICPPEDFTLDLSMLDRIVNRNLPVIVFDHVETMGPNFFLGAAPMHTSNQYHALNRAVHGFNVRAYFKRELLIDCVPPVSCPVFPLDWTIPNYPQFQTIDTEEQYHARPVDILMSWGYSSESRPRLHGELLRQSGRFCWHHAATEEDMNHSLEEKRQRIAGLLFTPHYRRIHIDKILAWQSQSKLSVSLKGCGLKCFRCAESSYNSLLVQQTPNDVRWSYPWISGENCIGLPSMNDGEINETVSLEILYDKLRVNQGSLYELYRKCTENQRNYIMENYSRNYLLPKIKKVLS